MLVRIRTNIATWRIKVPDTASLLDLKQILFTEYKIPIDQQEFEEISTDQSDDVLLHAIKPHGVKHGDMLSLKGRLEKEVVKDSYIDKDGVVVSAGTTLTRVISESSSDDKAGCNDTSSASSKAIEAKAECGAKVPSGSSAPASVSAPASSSSIHFGVEDQAATQQEEFFDPQCVPDPDMFDDYGEEQVRAPDAQKTETLLGQDPGSDIAYEFARHLNSRISLNDVLGSSVGSSEAFLRSRAINPAADSVESFNDIMRQMGRNPLQTHLYDGPPAAPVETHDSEISSPVDHVAPGTLSPASRRSLKAAGLTDEEIDMSCAVIPGAAQVGSNSSSSVVRSSHAGGPSGDAHSSLADRKLVQRSVALLSAANGEYVDAEGRDSKSFARAGESDTWMDVEGEEDADDDAALAQALAFSMGLADAKPDSSSRPHANSKSRSHSISGQDRRDSSPSGQSGHAEAKLRHDLRADSMVQRAADRINANRVDLSSGVADGAQGEDSLEVALMRAELQSLGFSTEEIQKQVEEFKRHNIEYGRPVASNNGGGATGGSWNRVPTDADGDYGPPLVAPVQRSVARTRAEERRDRIRERIGFDPRALTEDGVVIRPPRTPSPPVENAGGVLEAPGVADNGGDADDDDLAALLEIAIAESLRNS